jgi:hypothetical protein
MVLVAPPAPTLPPELEWPFGEIEQPSDGGSGGDWGGRDGGGGGGGWWNEEPDEWEADADAPRQRSRARRALSLFTVLVLALASVGGFLLLLMGVGSGAALSAQVLSVQSVGGRQATPSARVSFRVTNTAGQSSGARCVLSVFSGATELGSSTVFAGEPIDVGITERATVLVTLDRVARAPSATVTCEQASVVTAK